MERRYRIPVLGVIALALIVAFVLPVMGTHYDGYFYNLLIKGTVTTGGVEYTCPSADGTSGQHLTTDGSGTLTWSGSGYGSIDLPLTGFIQAATGHELNSGSTVPNLDIVDYIPALVWEDGETSSAAATFRVPDDYVSGGSFVLLCAQEAPGNTATKVDFDVYVNTDGEAFDTGTTNQTPVSLGSLTTTANCVVTLTPATDFASLAAGYIVTLRTWRDDGSGSTGALQTKNVAFRYVRSP